jgi:hypothetical protein
MKTGICRKSSFTHLEGQSYLSSERRLASRYNAWLHTELWNERIEAVMNLQRTLGL